MNQSLLPALNIKGFSGKLEFHSSIHIFISAPSASEPIYDLDWTSTPDSQSILAVGFAHHVELLCQQRKTYFGDDPAWTICFKVEVGRFVFPSSTGWSLTPRYQVHSLPNQ